MSNRIDGGARYPSSDMIRVTHFALKIEISDLINLGNLIERKRGKKYGIIYVSGA